MNHLCAEAPVLGLFVARSVVRRISAVVAELVLVISGHVGVLEVAVVLLLWWVARASGSGWLVTLISHRGCHQNAQQEYLSFTDKVRLSFVFRLQIDWLTTSEIFIVCSLAGSGTNSWWMVGHLSLFIRLDASLIRTTSRRRSPKRNGMKKKERVKEVLLYLCLYGSLLFFFFLFLRQRVSGPPV